MKHEYAKYLDILRNNIVKDYDEWCGHREYSRPMDTVVKAGHKFDRIFTISSGNSIWGFIAKKDFTHKGIDVKIGDVLKPAGRHGAAKHVRGNIFSDDTDWFSWCGPEYLFQKKGRLATKETKS